MLASSLPRALFFLVIAILWSFLSLHTYYLHGYNARMMVFWLGSLLCAGYAFFLFTDKKNAWRFGFTNYDAYLLIVLLLIFFPVYFFLLYYIPYQLNTDEPTIMAFAKVFTSNPRHDLFGLTNYFQYPALIFIMFGGIARALGGLDLFHFRLVHAASALLIIIFSYLFFRVGSLYLVKARSVVAHLIPFCAAVIVGFNHALIAISRMAMRDNSALLIEVIALSFLCLGLLRKNLLLLFLGGLVVGLSFYVYLPARIIIVLWALFLLGLGLFFEKEYRRRDLISAFVITCFGAVLVVSPLVIATVTAPETEWKDVSNKFLLSAQGQREQQAWVGAASVVEGLRINTMQGLTMFNNNLHDFNYIYPNYGHGFVDPLTGVLIWIGIVSILMRWARFGGRMEIHLFVVGCFLFLWLILSFLFNKNPHYNRLLSTLPFVAFLCVEALYFLGVVVSSIVSRYTKKTISLANIVLIGGVCTIVIWNLAIFSDFAQRGLREGDALGATARYTEQRAEIPGYSFYLAASVEHPYYSWGVEGQWQGWLKTFTQNNQYSAIVNPNALLYENLQIPFTLFMNKSVWDEYGNTLRSRFPSGTFLSMVSNGSRVALEVE